MKEIGKISVEDSYPKYRFFFKSKPKFLLIKHENMSLTFYYEVSDDEYNGEMLEYEIIPVTSGIHLDKEYEYIGYYEFKNLVHFLYIKQV